MNKSGKIKYYVGFLILVILTSSIYIILPDQVRIDVAKTNTKFSVMENGSWSLAAIEYVRLWDGTSKMNAKSRTLNETHNASHTTITRTSIWKDNITTIQTYLFQNNLTDVELTPIKEYFECYNCQGKIVSFEYEKITYDGKTKEISSPFSFGKNMKVEWENGSYYSKVRTYKTVEPKIFIKYKPVADYESYEVRLFDPHPDLKKKKPHNTINKTKAKDKYCKNKKCFIDESLITYSIEAQQ